MTQLSESSLDDNRRSRSPAGQSYDEQRDGREVTLVPHILYVHSESLTPSHRPHKEGLGEERKELVLLLLYNVVFAFGRQ